MNALSPSGQSISISSAGIVTSGPVSMINVSSVRTVEDDEDDDMDDADSLGDDDEIGVSEVTHQLAAAGTDRDIIKQSPSLSIKVPWVLLLQQLLPRSRENERITLLKRIPR